MTIDFLITFKNTRGETKEAARTLKYKDKLLDQRVLEKFEIERHYFEKHGTDWGIVTEQEVDTAVARNLADLHGYGSLDEIEGFIDIEKEERQDIVEVFFSRTIDYRGSLRNLCTSFDEDMQLIKGSSIALLKHLIINKVLLIDISEKLDLNQHLELRIGVLPESGGAETK